MRVPSDFNVSTDPIIRSMFNADLYDWWGKMLNLEEVHKYTTGKGVKIAVLDTGWHTHPDLIPDPEEVGIDFTGENDPTDRNGHGTHVRGIIGMERNGQGYVGISPDAIISTGKVLNSDGVGSLSSLIKAFDWVLDTEPDIVNLSLALDQYNSTIAKKIDQAFAKGILCVAAAGNYFKKELAFPASSLVALAVGAHDAGKLPAEFSHIAKNMQQAENLILAPGVHVRSSWIDGDYRSATGSSMASPMVAGCAALIVELERNLGA